MAKLLLPIGHPLGPVGPETDEYLVRTGGDVRRLPGGLGYAIWSLAHGVPELVRVRPWSRAALTRAATLDSATIDPLVDQLIQLGFLAEIPLTGPLAEQFAQQHRLQPLLCGIGWRRELGGGYALGVETDPIAVVPKFTYELWEWAAAVGNLWDLSTVFADAVAEVWEPGQPQPPEPAAMLEDVLTSLHLLLSQHGGYLDEY